MTNSNPMLEVLVGLALATVASFVLAVGVADLNPGLYVGGVAGLTLGEVLFGFGVGRIVEQRRRRT